MFNEEAHRAAGDGDAPARYEEGVTKQEEAQCVLCTTEIKMRV